MDECYNALSLETPKGADYTPLNKDEVQDELYEITEQPTKRPFTLPWKLRVTIFVLISVGVAGFLVYHARDKKNLGPDEQLVLYSSATGKTLAAFKAYDANGDGVINLDEFKLYMQKIDSDDAKLEMAFGSSWTYSKSLELFPNCKNLLKEACQQDSQNL
ncbi:calcium vector protein-like [Branchiostoma floridae x Branchiostoma japonicum]